MDFVRFSFRFNWESFAETSNNTHRQLQHRDDDWTGQPSEIVSVAGFDLWHALIEASCPRGAIHSVPKLRCGPHGPRTSNQTP
jgi:hypothetical protein